MGFFRKHKARDFSLADARRLEEESLKRLILTAISVENQPLKSRLDTVRQVAVEWGQWRELLARKEGENESDVR